jgi:hypothetical protein
MGAGRRTHRQLSDRSTLARILSWLQGKKRGLLLVPALVMVAIVLLVYEGDLSGTLPIAVHIKPIGTVGLQFPTHKDDVPLADWTGAAPSVPAPSVAASSKASPSSAPASSLPASSSAVPGKAEAPPKAPADAAGVLAGRLNALVLVALGTGLLFGFVNFAVVCVMLSMIWFQCIDPDQTFNLKRFQRYLALIGGLTLVLSVYLFPHFFLGWIHLDSWGAFMATVVDLPIATVKVTKAEVDSAIPYLPQLNLGLIFWSAVLVLVLTAAVSATGLISPLAYTHDLPTGLRPEDIATLRGPGKNQASIKQATDLLQRRLVNLQRILHLGSAVCFFGLVWLVAMTSIPSALTETIAPDKDGLPAAIGGLGTAVTFFWVTVYFALILGTLVPGVVWIEATIRMLYTADKTSSGVSFPQWLQDNKVNMADFSFFGLKEGAAIIAPFVPILLVKLNTALPILTG